MRNEKMQASDASCCEVGGSHSPAGRLGVLSAVFASACCGLPLLLIALGLGGLGMGSFLGRYHWYFMSVGVALLGAAWFVFLREKHRLSAAGATIRNQQLATILLSIATAAVMGFGGLNLYSSFGLGDKADEVARAADGDFGQVSQVVLPVEGMTCFTCEVAVEKALGKLDGVVEAKASASEGKVLVRYESGRVTFDQMVDAVNTTGYTASLPGS
jgi:copper chaperone CopZ